MRESGVAFPIACSAGVCFWRASAHFRARPPSWIWLLCGVEARENLPREHPLGPSIELQAKMAASKTWFVERSVVK